MTETKIETLWTPKDLATFLRISPDTVRQYSSRHPEKLPPRVAQMTAPRWHPQTVHDWCMGTAPVKSKGGRPRKPLPVLI
jgi:hypothetical protein